MDSKTYNIEASRTMANVWNLKIDTQEELHCAIGITTEVGELAEALNNRAIDLVNIMEEVGDVFWYLSGFCRKYDFILEDEFVSDFAYDQIGDAVLDLVVFSGELLDIYKKHTFYGRKLEPELIVSQCEAIFSICVSLLSAVGYTVHQARQINIDKLKKRFPDKFTSEKANNRDLETERNILEGK